MDRKTVGLLGFTGVALVAATVSAASKKPTNGIKGKKREFTANSSGEADARHRSTLDDTLPGGQRVGGKAKTEGRPFYAIGRVGSIVT